MPEFTDFNNLDEAMDDYFSYFRMLASSSRAERIAAHSELNDWLQECLLSPPWKVRPDADAIWRVVVALVARAAENPEELAIVIAGPLEDLVYQHGVVFGERIVEQTRTDRRFRMAMSGMVSLDTVPDVYRSQLRVLLDRPG